MRLIASFVFLLFAATTFTAVSSFSGDFIGSWSYEVLNTPNGDYRGELNIAKDGDAYSGFIMTGEQKTTLRNVKVTDGVLSFGLYVEDAYVTVKLEYEGNKLKGRVNAQGEYFTMTAMPK